MEWAFNMDSMLSVEADTEEEAVVRGIEQLRDTLTRYTTEELVKGFEWYVEGDEWAT